MKIGFLIVTYGNKYLNECVLSIKKYHNNIPIYIVDNMLENNINIIDSNVFYSNNINNNYELGAIWFASKKWNLVDEFIILHKHYLKKGTILYSFP